LTHGLSKTLQFFADHVLAKMRVTRNRAERQGGSFAMPVRRRCRVVPMAISRPAMTRPAMSRPTMVAGVAACVAANMAIAHILFVDARDLGVGAIGCNRVLAAAIPTIPRDTMAARHRAEYGQALIIGVRRLNFFAFVDAARRGFRTNGGRDQCGGEKTVQE
jgi:hypothetical protein